MDVNVDSTETYPKLTKVDLKVIGYNINNSAKVSVDYYNDQNLKIDTRHVSLTGTDFDNWGTDDQYLIDHVLTELGLTETVEDGY